MKCRRPAKDRALATANWQRSSTGWLPAHPGQRSAVTAAFDFTTSERAGRDWWSLRSPVRPAVPDAPSLRAWVRTPVDAFIARELVAHGLTPSPEADLLTLIRRATFDLWGLPPDPADVEAFVAEPVPDAYERLVDRLLASEHYGERAAQQWLDVVRFGESNGYETNTPRPNAWPYRDYVIAAFNQDMPWPQFIRDQLAGDQCGADVATSYLVAGPHDTVGSPDVELTRQQRHADLDDMAGVTAQAFLAVTVSCAKCHDHKFDPVTQKDYYALQAVFSGVFHGERDVKRQLTDEDRRRLERAQRDLAAAEQRQQQLLTSAEPFARVDAAASGTQRLPIHWLGNVDRFPPVTRMLRVLHRFGDETIRALLG